MNFWNLKICTQQTNKKVNCEFEAVGSEKCYQDKTKIYPIEGMEQGRSKFCGSNTHIDYKTSIKNVGFSDKVVDYPTVIIDSRYFKLVMG